MLQKLKSLLLDDTVYIAFLLVLVGVASFGLGRMSVSIPSIQTGAVVQSLVNLPKSQALEPLSTTTASGPTQTKEVLVSEIATPKNFVASKSGTKYHSLTCPGAKQIKDTNKIFFGTEDEAESAGYSRAANCKF